MEHSAAFDRAYRYKVDSYAMFHRLLNNGQAWRGDFKPMVQTELLHANALIGPLTFWTPEMQSLMEHTADTMPATHVFERDHVLGPFGLHWFNRPLPVPPLTMPDGDRVEAAHAIGIVPVIDPFADTVKWDLREPFDRAAGVGISVWYIAHGVITPAWKFHAGFGRSLGYQLEWAHSRPHKDPTARLLPEEEWLEAIAYKLAFATCLVSSDRVSVRSPAQPSRGFRRRMAIQTTPVQGDEMIRLRRSANTPSAAESDGTSLSVQFVVTGHWRQQWYPSEQRHKAKWISPYIKGPAGAPMKQRSSSYYVSR